jgi:hypothetical protein
VARLPVFGAALSVDRSEDGIGTFGFIGWFQVVPYRL